MRLALLAVALLLAPGSVCGASAAPPSRDARHPAPDAAFAHSAFRLREAGVLAARGDAPGRVLEPSGLAVDAFGRVVVADAGLHRLQQLDPDGTLRWEAGGLGSDPGQLRRPQAVTLIGTLAVAVLDLENRRIATWDLFGRRGEVLVDLAALEADDPVGRIEPVAMAADRGGAVVVADGERDRLLVFDFSGRRVATLGGVGAKPGSFRGLRGVAIAPRGEIVTAERIGARIQRLDAGGRPVAAWPLAVAPGHGALALACDDSGRVAVADEDAGRLRVFDAAGRPIALIDGLAGPRAAAFARDGTLLVAEARAGRVRRFALEPAPAER